MPQYYLMLILLTNLFDLPAEYAGIPLLDIDSLSSSQTIVDRESQKYLGHPTTVMLEDQKTILAVYPQGHGKGQIIFKRSRDGGKSWSERLRVPDNWATSKETPTIHRVVDAQVFSGLYPARMAVSEDDGETWSSLNPVGDWGGIVVMSSLIALKTPGHYLGLFHDDGRFIRKDGKSDGVMTLYQV
ncbi:MAG TPA: sialidase family protein, partial [Gemmatales bacterium]|nr:sialidase family protein [Gemmatales bacterium]